MRELVSLIGIAPVLGCWAYTAERQWVHQAAESPHVLQALRGAEEQAGFRAALANCVAAHDPAHVGELKSEGGYRLSGWFLSGRRGMVASCLRGKGSLGVPRVLVP